MAAHFIMITNNKYWAQSIGIGLKKEAAVKKEKRATSL
jgi:hypothetical protein